MSSRFAFFILPLVLCACGGREAVATHSGPPVYRDQDLEEAAAAAGHHLDTSERLSQLETEMKVVKIELSKLSGAAQRIEARQLQTGGVTPEPSSASAAPIEEGKPRKHARKASPPAEPAVAQGAEAPVSDKTIAAIQETANVDGLSHAAKPADSSPAPAPAEPKAAANPAPVPSQAPSPSANAAVPGNPGFGIQLGAYASTDRAVAAWNGLKDQGGKLLSDLLPKHESVTVAGKTVYRLKAGPLPDESTAQSRCDGLKAQNIQCIVAPFSGEWPSS